MQRSAILGMLAIATTPIPGHAISAELSEAELKEAIVLRCHYEMGEFGVDPVRSCIERENAAFASMSSYPSEHKDIVARCRHLGLSTGWEIARICVEKDLEAEAALARYPPEQSARIEQCRKELAERGPAQVRACVDAQPADPATTKRP